jgi:3-aminobutyryl-CoA ammonia-lyase
MTHQPYVGRRRPEVGFRLVHRRYVHHGEAHYAGGLASGAFVIALFNDIATDLCVQVDNDEGLFASYSEVNFHAPLHAGDVLEVSVEVVRVGTRSRTLRFDAHVLSRANPDAGITAASVLAEPLLVTSAVGTVVVPTAHTGKSVRSSEGERVDDKH